MKLYSYFRSAPSFRVRIVLNFKGLKADMAFIDLLKGEQQSASYTGVNPQQVVPSLIDEGKTIIQSLAILEYLEEAYPAPALLPSDLFARAHVRALALVIGADTSPLGNLKVRKKLQKQGLSDEDTNAWVRHWIADGLRAYEELIKASPYIGIFSCGDTPTIADCCLIPQLYNAERFECSLEPYPLIRRIADACNVHPAFIAAHPSKQSDAA